MAEQGGVLAIDGVLETSLYARDLKRTAAFYRDLFGFKALVDSPRLVAFEIAQRSVLLVFQTGATEQDVVDPGGTIPGHDGRGRLHLAFSIGADDLDAWRERLAERGVDIVGEYRGREAERASICAIRTGHWWNWRRRASGGEVRRCRLFVRSLGTTGFRPARIPSAS